MNHDQVREALKGYAVVFIGDSVKKHGCKEVVIGSSGRDLNGTRTFTAKKFETIVKQIKNVYRLD